MCADYTYSQAPFQANNCLNQQIMNMNDCSSSGSFYYNQLNNNFDNTFLESEQSNNYQQNLNYTVNPEPAKLYSDDFQYDFNIHPSFYDSHQLGGVYNEQCQEIYYDPAFLPQIQSPLSIISDSFLNNQLQQKQQAVYYDAYSDTVSVGNTTNSISTMTPPVNTSDVSVSFNVNGEGYFPSMEDNFHSYETVYNKEDSQDSCINHVESKIDFQPSHNHFDEPEDNRINVNQVRERRISVSTVSSESSHNSSIYIVNDNIMGIHSVKSGNIRSTSVFHCDYRGCTKTFTRTYNLKSHRRTHTDEKPFTCKICTKPFARQHDRNRHEKLHLGLKPYSCSYCDKTFARLDALNRHLKRDKKLSKDHLNVTRIPTCILSKRKKQLQANLRKKKSFPN